MSTDATHPEPSARLRAGIAAALARPVLLDPRAVEGVRDAAGFRARPEAASASEAPPFTRAGAHGDVAVVDVSGPLAQRAWSCMGMFGGDGYDSILQRVQAALDDRQTAAVVLRMDSPGGEVAGCFECVRALRVAGAAAGKPLVAAVDELCASAAYALACACDAIVAPDTGCVGSVGVILALTERSTQLATAGVTTNVITSGAAKADGHPALPMSPDARARLQAEVDHLAGVFHAEVAAARGMTAAAVRGLEAQCFYGAAAVAAGLADQVGNLNDAIDLARTRAARTSKRTRMEAIAKKLGLPADASEADVLATLAARDLDAARAAQTVASLSEDLAAANTRAALAEKRADEMLRAAEIEGAKADRKWSASLEPFLATLSVDQLKSWRASAPAVVPSGAIDPPKDDASAEPALPPDIAALAAKGWSALTVDGKHAVSVHDPKLAARLRAAR